MATIVDIHSHVFNAEDLPIDGFLRRLSPLPPFVTAVVSKPFDELASWRAPGRREQRVLLRLIEEAGAGERQGVEPVAGVSDAEIRALIGAECSARGLLPRRGPEPVDEAPTLDALSAAVQRLPADERRELARWSAELGEGPREPGAEAPFEPIADPTAGVFRAIRRFVAALRLTMRHRYQIAGRLAATYPEVRLFVPALVDFTVPAHDAPSTRVRDQIEIHSLLGRLSTLGGIPGAPDTRVHPFVAFDPYREIAETSLRDRGPDASGENGYQPFRDGRCYSRDLRFDPARAPTLPARAAGGTMPTLELSGVFGALDLVRHAVERGGFVGVKLYPPSGFLPLGNVERFGAGLGARLDAALRALYSYCEAMDLPILAHANDSVEFADGYGRFAGPDGWERVLREFPDLRVCLGHFGHLTGVDLTRPAEPAPDSWPWRFIGLIDRYPNVYADVGNSRFPIDAAYRANFLSMLRAMFERGAEPVRRRRQRRILYGSDWWLNAMARAHEDYLDSFRAAFDATFPAPVVAGFFGANALRFLGFNGPDDAPDFANRNRRRLEQFYGAAPRPAWLRRPD